MQRSSLALAAFGVVLACLVSFAAVAQETHETKDSATAYTALRLVGKTLGADAINRVVELSGRDGKPQPVSWRIVLKEGEGTREVEVVNGKIVAQRPLSQPVSSAPIKLQDLNLDSSGAFEATDAQARKTRVRFDSINYTLRTSEKTGKPVWTLELYNQTSAGVGTMRIAANNGTVASMDGRIAAEPAAVQKKTETEQKSTPKPAVASVRPAATPKPSPAVVAVERPAPRREVVTTTPPVTTTTTTTSTTTLQTNQPVAVIDVPDADPGNVTVQTTTEDGGGFFTRTGRTLDRTSHTVTRSLDRAGHDVDHGLRRAGATVERFFTGRSDLDSDIRSAPAQENGEPD